MKASLIKKNDNKYYITRDTEALFEDVEFVNEKVEDGKRYIWIVGRLIDNHYFRKKKINLGKLVDNNFTLEFDEPFSKINEVKFIAIESNGWNDESYKFEIIEEMDKLDLLTEMYNSIIELKKEIEELKDKSNNIEKMVDSIAEHFNCNSGRRSYYDD